MFRINDATSGGDEDDVCDLLRSWACVLRSNAALDTNNPFLSARKHERTKTRKQKAGRQGPQKSHTCPCAGKHDSQHPIQNGSQMDDGRLVF